MVSVAGVRAVPGRGLEGDRDFSSEGTWSRSRDTELTLVELEAIEALARDHGIEMPARDARRNVVTRGIALNHLVGKRFAVGGVVLEGMRLCEPCGHLEKLAGRPGVKGALVHRGGLRARVVSEGIIRVGDPVRA